MNAGGVLYRDEAVAHILSRSDVLAVEATSTEPSR
jgi:hypothetical protein